jgi:hypothetical protein
MAKQIGVVACRVGQPPRVEYIDNDLKAAQAFVGGYIEVLPIGGNLRCICNEEGALRGLPVGFRVYGTPIHGDCFIARLTKRGDFASVSDKQAASLGSDHALLARMTGPGATP